MSEPEIVAMDGASMDGASMDGASTDGGSAGHDGRFGQRFDDEVKVSSVLWTTFGLALACVLGMLITWGMKSYYVARAEAEAVRPSPYVAAGQQKPEGPLLQRDPEGELEAMRREMADRLGGYGWVEGDVGVAHIPIDVAMDLLVEQGSVAAGESPGSAGSVEGSGE